MSKITKALEKAARERLEHRQHEHATVTPKTMELVLAAPQSMAHPEDAGTVRIDPHIVAATDPQSPVAEQYRILRTNLQSLKIATGPKTLVLTSAVHEEGKSVTAINLALTLAQQEELKVLLIDADMRRSTIHRWLGLDREKGLSSVLSNGLELDGAVVRLQSPPLAVLPAGPHPDRPAELLESAAMRRLLALLKTQYDVIIIDAPPILPVTDPGILGAQSDGVLLVVRAGKTQRTVVKQAMALLKHSKAKLLGSVLTHVDYYIPGYYRYYHYYRYGAKDSGGNGHEETKDQGQGTSQDSTTTAVAQSAS